MSATQTAHEAPVAPLVRSHFAVVAIVVALACVYLTGLPWLIYRFGATNPSFGILQFGPLMILALLCWGIAPLAGRFFRGARGLIPAALLMYCIMTSIGGFATDGGALQIPPIVTAPKYFATAENHFEQEVLPLLPDTLMIKNERAARGYYEGDYALGIPWGRWVGPLARWGFLILAYLLTSICLVGMFRRRWIHEERIAFPLAEIVLFVAGRGSFGMARDNPRVRARLLQIGILLPLLVHSYNSLNYYIPSIPQIPLGPYYLGRMLQYSPWIAVTSGSWTFTYLRFTTVGIAYLMPSAMAVGIFGFFIAFLMLHVISRFLGDPTLGPLHFSSWNSAIYHQVGTYAGLLLFTAWTARHDLKRMAVELFAGLGGKPPRDPHPDRWMLAGFVVGLTLVCWWGISAGVTPMVMLIFVLGALALNFGLSVISAIAGLPVVEADNFPQEYLLAFVPPKTLGPRNLMLLGLFDRLFAYNKQHSPMPSALQSFKIADSERIPTRTLITTLCVAAVVVIVLNTSSMLDFGYNRSLLLSATSAFHTPSWNMPHFEITVAQQQLAEANPVLRYPWLLLGVVSMWGMQLLYRQFAWWPVHPLGMMLPWSAQTEVQWFSVLIGWVIARVITRYAGPKSYVSARPLFLGLVIGDAAAAALWVVIDMITGVRRPPVSIF